MTLRIDLGYDGFTLRCVLAVASFTVAILIWFINPPTISNVSIDFPANPSQRLEGISMPFSRGSIKESATFAVTATISHNASSSGVIRVTFDECIEAMYVNGIEVSEVTTLDKSKRCIWWTPLAIDLAHYLTVGSNIIKIQLSDKSGMYGINVTGAYTLPALYGLIAAFGIFLYVGLFALLARSSILPSCRRHFSGRVHKVAFLPCMGLLYLCVVQANAHGESWIEDRGLIALAALTVSLALLIRLLDRQATEALLLRLSPYAAILSICGFVYSSLLIPINDWMGLKSFLYALFGTLAGFFAFLPLLPLARRPLSIALLATISPWAYSVLNLPLWVIISGMTTTMVRGILWLCGFPTTTLTGENRGDVGQLVDYYTYITSSDFSVQIGSWCSGLEGVFLFFFLLSTFILIDWPLFSKLRYLWSIYVLAILFVLVVNALRIAGLFLFAEWYAWRYDHTAASQVAIEVFHSNIGWILYSIAFALLLPLVYRWARRAEKIS